MGNNVSDPVAGTSLANASKNMGNWDGLWLSAGYAGVTPLDAIDADFLDRMMNTNVRGPALQLAGLGPKLSKAGSVVITSSTAAYEGAAMASVYAATKATIVATARCWASAGSSGKAIAVALFLLCDDSSYVTVANTLLMGGLTLPWNFAASVRSLFWCHCSQ
ncbi:SDR family oxidoreductase [Rhizobium sullae]|uniref:SDR family oxidoreductase n=1 Tax=Rhizobium sullae TaxID=50338 RepID=UPI001FD3D6D6|nr:SDR family oxidoreductase [Rhizobium sullae]